jgi:uncharacterized protein YndB with AHSA1/START domain
MFVDAQALARWWGPNGFTCPSVELDARAGGTYRIEMQPPEGAAFYLRGEYRRVEPPAELEYTFVWEDPDPDDRETVVVVSLHDRGDATELIVDQGPFATEARRALHDQGWTDTLGRLQALLTEETT